MISNKLTEDKFYVFFTSFEQLENEIFVEFFNQTLLVLTKDENYENYPSKEKLLSFYYTFFEMLTANRSYVVWALKNQSLNSLKQLSGLRVQFLKYIKGLNIESFGFLNNTSFGSFKDKTVEELTWLQFLSTFKFYLDDTSESFQKTDVFIEKSLNASFDLIDLEPLKQVVDFGKFLIKEKVNFTI